LSERERLQKAVETTMAAGYQLDREAFDFLSAIAATDDPSSLVCKALQRIEGLEEKPLFICKSYLETILNQPEVIEEIVVQPQPQIPEEISVEPEETYQYPEASSVYHPYAKDVESQINVIEDLQYFQDRFKRMEKLLRQRMDVKAATPIAEALKSQAKTKLKIIGMVQEKREAKQQLLITIEDLQASATILVPTKAPEEVHRKAQLLLPDQVICFAVAKTRGDLFLAEDIIFPEVGQKPIRRAAEPASMETSR
jgi:DNA polymerase II small subunit/DNA polymerase delta subunit B